MRPIFVDAAFLIALVDTSDDLHEIAVLVLQELHAESGVSFHTTDIVLAEVLTYFSKFTERDRKAALALVRRTRSEGNIQVIALTPELFDRATSHYESRLDKQYSFSDCLSMVVCRDLGIVEILTHDHDFEQEGLRILL